MRRGESPREVMKEPETAEVLRAVNAERLVDLARRLIGVRSVTTDPEPEAQIAQVVETEWRTIGLETSVEEFQRGRANVVGLLRGVRPGPRLAFQAHMDTGHPSAHCRYDPFAAHLDREGGWLYGCGSVNMKHTLAANTEAVRAIRESGIPFSGEIALVAVGGEGSGAIGSRALMDQGFRADMCVIGEPTEQVVLTAHTGAVQLAVTTHGQQRHISTVPSEGRGGDAIAAMVTLVRRLQAARGVFRFRRHPILGAPLVCIGHVRGGREGRPAWFAEECRCEVDIRTVPGMTPRTVERDVQAVIRRLRHADPTFSATVEIWERSKNLLPVAVPSDAPVVRLARRAYRLVCGQDPLIGSPVPMRYYFTDACTWTNFGRIPTINFGAGKLSEATPEERVRVADVVTMAKVYAVMPRLLDGLVGPAGSGRRRAGLANRAT